MASVFFLLLCLLLSTNLQLQAQSLTKFDCDDIGVSICANDGSSSGCDECALTLPNCRRVQFEVTLTIDHPTLTNTTISLDYAQLTISTKLVVTDAEYNLPLSRIDYEATKDCSDGYDWDCYFWPDAANGEALLDIQSDAGINCGSGTLPTLEITLDGSGHGELHLYTVIVEAWPDESLQLICNGLIYSTEEAIGFEDLGTDGLFTCSDDGSEDSNNDMSCTSSSVISLESTGLSTSSNYWIILHEVDLTDHPDYHESLIQVRAMAATASNPYLDFTFLVTVTEDMIDPVIMEDDQDDLDIEWTRKKFVDGGGQTNYLFYVRLVSTTAIGTGYSDLCILRVNGPVFASGGGEACVSFGKGRLQDGTTTCALIQHDNLFEDNNDDCTSFGDTPDACTNDLEVSVTAITPTGCGDFQIEVEFGFSGTNDYLDLDVFKLQLEFEGVDVEITDIDLGGAVDNCGAGNPITCDDADCYAGVGTNTFNLCFQEALGGPLTIYRDRPITIEMSSSSGCIGGVIFRRAEISEAGGDLETCIPAEEDRIAINFPICSPYIFGRIRNTNDKAVEDVIVRITDTDNPPTYDVDVTSDCVGYAICVPGYDDYIITPAKSNDPLNGVSTYDMVLINKHVLGLEYFSDLEQRIAADANLSEAVSIADVIEIRKVILGLETNFYDDFDNKISWRFYQETADLESILDDPYDMSEVPDIIENHLDNITVAVSALGNDPDNLNFKAVKIGDVNNNNVPNASCPGMRPGVEPPNAGLYPVALQVNSTAKGGGFVHIPLLNEGKIPLHGLQAAFRFEPAAMEFLGASKGETEGIDQACFGLTEVSQGIIRMVWISPDMDQMTWKPGQALCYLSFRVKDGTREGAVLLALDENVLAGQAYTADKRIYDLELKATAAQERSKKVGLPFSAQIQPNPNSGTAALVVEAGEALERVRIAVFSAFGQRLVYRETALPAGTTELALPELAGLVPGIYTWRVWTNTSSQEGKMIRQ